MSLAYFEWSAPEDADPADPAAWAQANPALGVQISESFLEAQLGSMRPDLFGREHLSWWSETVDEHPISREMWAAIFDEAFVPGAFVTPPSFGIAANVDVSLASIGTYALGPDGLPRVDLADVLPTDASLPRRLVELRDKYRGAVFELDPGSPAGALIGAIEAAGITLRKPTMREYAQGCGALYVQIRSGTVRQLGDPDLTAAALHASKRPLGDLWAWSRKDGDVAALEAVTLAAIAAGVTNGPSIYEERGPLIF